MTPELDLRSRPRALIWTVGHGTRATEGLADLLRGGRRDDRHRRSPLPGRVAGSPHLARERLEVDLPRARHRLRMVGRGSWRSASNARRRRATPSPWRSPGFAAYAAYMLTDDFRTALSALEGRAEAGEALAVMCAETLLVALPPAVDRRCSRFRRLRSSSSDRSAARRRRTGFRRLRPSRWRAPSTRSGATGARDRPECTCTSGAKEMKMSRRPYRFTTTGGSDEREARSLSAPLLAVRARRGSRPAARRIGLPRG